MIYYFVWLVSVWMFLLEMQSIQSAVQNCFIFIALVGVPWLWYSYLEIASKTSLVCILWGWILRSHLTPNLVLYIVFIPYNKSMSDSVNFLHSAVISKHAPLDMFEFVPAFGDLPEMRVTLTSPPPWRRRRIILLGVKWNLYKNQKYLALLLS